MGDPLNAATIINHLAKVVHRQYADFVGKASHITGWNGELSQNFERRYPGFPVANDENHDLYEVKLAA